MFSIFKPTVKQFPSKSLGKIIQPLLKDLFSDEAFDDPDHSPVGGGAPYTYLNMLDKWYVLERNPNFIKLVSNKDKMLFLADTRGYTQDEKQMLTVKEDADYPECIMSIIDYEFIYDNPLDTNGVIYKSIRPELISMIPKIEEYYLRTRKDKSIKRSSEG